MPSWTPGRVSRKKQCRVSHTQTKHAHDQASILEHSEEQLSTWWGNATYFMTVSAWVTVSSTGLLWLQLLSSCFDNGLLDKEPAAAFFRCELSE